MPSPSAAEEGELDESIARIMRSTECSAEEARTRLQEAGMNADGGVAVWMAEMYDFELDESIARIMRFTNCSAEEARSRLQKEGNADRTIAVWMAEMYD